MSAQKFHGEMLFPTETTSALTQDFCKHAEEIYPLNTKELWGDTCLGMLKL